MSAKGAKGICTPDDLISLHHASKLEGLVGRLRLRFQTSEPSERHDALVEQLSAIWQRWMKLDALGPATVIERAVAARLMSTSCNCPAS